jgi:hypothetical protein
MDWLNFVERMMDAKWLSFGELYIRSIEILNIANHSGNTLRFCSRSSPYFFFTSYFFY